jgi:TP901 family phage tail tape measure protein
MASATVGILRVLLSANTAEFEQAMQKASSSMGAMTKDFNNIGQQATKLGTSLTAAITLPLAGIATAAIKTGMDFEKVMNSISGTLQPTGDQMERIRELAMKMGAETVFSATDAAEAILELGKAGMSTETAMQSVDEVLQLAAASGFTMAEAAEMSARTLNAFGLEAEDLAHVNDVLAQAVNSTSLNLRDMQVAFGYVGPIAQGFGLSIEQVSAALGIMRDNGIAAETTGRALREGLDRLINPVKSVEEVMKELGISSFTVNGKLLDLSQIVGLLQEKGITAGQALKMFGDAAGPGMFALVKEGQPALDALTKELEKSEGAAKKLADEMMKGLPGAFEKLKGSAETALLAISKAIEPAAIAILGVFERMADFVTNVIVPGFEALPVPVQAFGLALLAAAAAAGPILLVVGQLATGLGALTAFFAPNAAGAKMMAAAWGLVAPAITPLLTMLPALGSSLLALATGPIGIIAAAVVALGAIWLKWGDDIKRIVTDVFNTVDKFLGGALSSTFSNLTATLSNVASIITSLVVIAFYELRDAARDAWQFLKDNVQPIVEGLKISFAQWAGITTDQVIPAIKGIGIVILASIPGLQTLMASVAWLSDHTPGWAKSTGEAAKSLDALAQSYNTTNAEGAKTQAGIGNLTTLFTSGFVPAVDKGAQGFHQFGAAAATSKPKLDAHTNSTK